MLRKIVTILMIVCIIVAMFTISATAEDNLYRFGRTTTRLRLRAKASTESDGLGVYPEGALVEVLAWDGDWLKVPGGYVNAAYVQEFTGYLAEGGFQSQGQFYSVSQMKAENMKNLSNHYLGFLRAGQLASKVNGEGKAFFEVNGTGFCVPIYDVIGEYAYFAIGASVYRLHIQCFPSLLWIGEQVPNATYVSAYMTYYGSSEENRKNNIEIAAQAINGSVVKSGETFSYNQTTGERTAKKGYKEAPVYDNGKESRGIAGGVCQLSSTIYSSVMNLSNIKIVERHEHSLPVHYLPMDMDATVSWQKQDFRFRNNFSFDIQVQVVAHDGFLLVLIQRV